MANISHRTEWFVPERQVSPEDAFKNRRQFLTQLGLAGGVLAAALAGCSQSESSAPSPDLPLPDAQGVTLPKGYPASRNREFNPAWRLTPENVAGSYNNFYEFSLGKDPYEYVGRFATRPWPVEIGGLVEKPMTLDAFELADLFGLEE